jgi:hypothetical protein
MRRIASRVVAVALAMSLGLAFTTDSANAWGSGGGGGSGGPPRDNRTPGQKAMDKRSKDNPNKNKSKNGPSGDQGLKKGPFKHF